jgi:hypothetical protein
MWVAMVDIVQYAFAPSCLLHSMLQQRRAYTMQIAALGGSIDC